MNKSSRMQLTISKPSSKELAKIKDKLRSQDQRLRQYESMCQSEENKQSHSIIPFYKRSKKDLRHGNSPVHVARSKSKTLQRSIKKLSQQKPQKAGIGDLYSELMAVKSQYNNLKQSYNRLVVEKNELTSRQLTEKEAIQSELQLRSRELQKYQRMVQGYEQQIERVKRQCCKLLQNERLKNKKLEQTIQEKDLMIAFLRNEIDKKRGTQTTLSSINQSSLIFLQNNPFTFQVDKLTPQSSLLSNVVVQEINNCRMKIDDDSLSFSRDKSKEMDSIHSFLTAHDQSAYCATKKDIVIVETHSSCAENESDQCPTFQQRGEEQCEDNLRSSFNPIKNSLLSKHDKKIINSLPPKNKNTKGGDYLKKQRYQTDQNNIVDSNKSQLIDSKKCLSSRKKTSSKKKKP